MKFGLFGSAQAKRGGSPDVDSAKGYRDWLEFNIEAEALGYHSAFAVEHHFTGFGQVSATINLLTFNVGVIILFSIDNSSSINKNFLTCSI